MNTIRKRQGLLKILLQSIPITLVAIIVAQLSQDNTLLGSLGLALLLLTPPLTALLYGLRSGLVSVSLVILYSAYHFFTFGEGIPSSNTEDFRRLFILSPASLLLTVVVGMLQRSLSASERRLRRELTFSDSITGSLGEGVCVLDLQCRLTFANPAAEKILGRTRAELLGEDFHEFICLHQAGGTGASSSEECPLLRAIHSGSTHRSEDDEFIRGDGTMVPVDYTVSSIRWDGEEAGAVLVFRDITERKVAEAAVEESEERFRSLVQNTSDIITILEADGTIRYESPSIERILGYSLEEMIGTNAFEYVHPDDAERVVGVFNEELLRSRRNRGVEFRFRHKDGSWRYLEALGSNLIDDPSIRGVVVNSRDVTERKEAEEEIRQLNESLERRVEERTAEMREAKERFRSIFEHAAIGMSLYDPNGHFIQVNPALCEILGRSEEELLGTTFQEVTHPDDVETSVEHVQRLLNGETSGYQLEKRYLHADGYPVWASISVSLMKDSESRPLYLIVQMQDITERKQAEEDLRERVGHSYRISWTVRTTSYRA
jgi:PAS domain S-box-containing protein